MTVIIVILCIAALAWGAVLAYRGSILAGCGALLIATCCFSNEFWSIDAAGLTWAVDRFCLLGLVGLFAAQCLVRRADHKPIATGDILLGLLLALIVVSTFTHGWRTLGPDQVSIVMHLVNGYLIPATVYWIVRESTINERGACILHAILACFGAYLAFTAICEVARFWPLVFPKYIANPNVGIHFGRARGPMVQSAQLGTFLVAGFAATWILLGWQGVWGRFGKLLTVLIAPLYGAALFLTYTRSAWIGAGLALAVGLALILQGRSRMFALGSMAATAVLILAVKGSDLVSMERETSGAVTRESTYMRASFAYVSWQIFRDQPLTGVGFGQFPRVSPYYLSDRDTELDLESIRGYIHHNTFLSILVELGVVGLVLFALILIDWTRSALHLWRDQRLPDWMRVQGLLMLVVFAPYFCQLMFREVSYSLQESVLIFLLAGLTSGLRAMQLRQGAAAPVGSATFFRSAIPAH